MNPEEDARTEDIRRLVKILETQRDAAMELVEKLTDEDLDLFYTDQTQGQEEGAFTIRRLLHRITTHHQDHLQHILRLRREMGKPRSEALVAMTELQVARTRLLYALVGLTDDDIRKDVSGGNEMGNLRPNGLFPDQNEVVEEYTMKRIMEHVVEMEEMRWGHMRMALDLGNS